MTDHHKTRIRNLLRKNGVIVWDDLTTGTLTGVPAAAVLFWEPCIKRGRTEDGDENPELDQVVPDRTIVTINGQGSSGGQLRAMVPMDPNAFALAYKDALIESNRIAAGRASD